MTSIFSVLLLAFAVTGATAPAPVTQASDAITRPAVVNFAGRVLERGTRAPVSEAEVTLTKLNRSTFTGADGSFAFENVPAGKHKISVPSAGYQRFKTTEEIGTAERTDVVYYLSPDAGAVEEVIVEVDVGKKEVSKTVLSREEIRKVPGTGNDAIKVVASLPGVAVANELSPDLIVRGSGPADNFTEVDRIQVPYLFHFGGIRSVINSDMMKSVDFQAGGFSSLYGSATGGIIAAHTRPGRKDRFGGAIDVNTMLAEAFVEGPVGKKGSFIAAARRSYFEATLAPVVKAGSSEDDVKFSVFPQFYDYQLRGDYELVTDTTLTAFVFGSDDVLKLFAPKVNPQDPDATGSIFSHTNFDVQSIAAKTRVSAGVTNRLSTYHIGNRTDIDIADKFVDYYVQSFGITDDVSIEVTPSHTLGLGTSAHLDRIDMNMFIFAAPAEGESDFSFTEAKAIPYTRILRSANVGLYAEDRMQVTSNWTVTPGVRFDYYKQEQGYTYLDPRLQTRWEATKKTALKASVGQYSKFADMPTLDRKFGNPELKPMHTTHYVAGVEHRVTANDSFDLQGYYKSFDNLVFSYPAGEKFRNTQTGESYGVELAARHKLTSRFFGWASYAYSRSFRRDPRNQAWLPAPYDQPHIVNAVASYKITQRWETGLKWRYSSGNPTTPIKDRVYLADQARYIPIGGEPNSARLPSSHRLDARIEYSHPYETWILRTYLEVLNVYAKKNAADYSDNYDYTSKDAIALLPVPIPMFGVRGEF